MTVIPGVPLPNFFLSVPETLCSAGVEVLAPKRGMLPLEDVMTIALK